MIVTTCMRTVAVLAASFAMSGCAGVGWNPYATYQRTDPANPAVRDAIQPGGFVVAVKGTIDPVVIHGLIADAVRSGGGGTLSRITEPSADPAVTARWRVDGFGGDVRAVLHALLPERHIVEDDRLEVEMEETVITLRASMLDTAARLTPAAARPTPGK